MSVYGSPAKCARQDPWILLALGRHLKSVPGSGHDAKEDMKCSWVSMNGLVHDDFRSHGFSPCPVKPGDGPTGFGRS